MRSLRDLVPRPAPPVRVVPGRVAVVIPAFNESGKIGAVVRKVPRRSAGCVIVVDDASADATSDEARAAGAGRVLRYRVREVPVTVRYHARGTTKMRLMRDGWRILRPIVYLRLGLKR